MTDGFFDALDAVLDENTAKNERAKVTLSAAQEYIDYGNKIFLLTPSVARQQMVVGRVIQPEDWADVRDLVETLSMAGTPSQPVPSDEELRKSHDNGYRLGLFFGEDYPLGYVASYHISRLYPITDTEFDGIREVNCDPNEAAKNSWFGELENNIITAIESHPDSPYRKVCENPSCGSSRVMIAEYFEMRHLSPAALRMNVLNQSLDVLTTHAITSDVVEVRRRCFRCMDCKWESEPLTMEEWPEVHVCNSDKSSLEALFDVERFVL